MVVSDLSVLVERLQRVAAHNEEARVRTLDALEALQLKLETPYDLIMRTSFTHIQVVATRMAGDLKIYEILSSHGEPMTAAEMAAKTGAAPRFTRHLLCYLSSVGHIQETGRDTFAATAVTKVLAQPGSRGAAYNMHTNLGPGLWELPAFLREIGYANVDTTTKTASQKAAGTDKSIYEWLQQDPERDRYFQMHMAGMHAQSTPWYEVFPFEAELASFSGSQSRVFVDVAGGLGHQCTQLLSAFPQLHGGLVLQETAATVALLGSSLEGVHVMEHDIFEVQPVKGAKFYYMRNIIHNWPDQKAVRILTRLREALEPGSSILIDDIVLPNEGAHWHATSIDMVMLASLGSCERTFDELCALLKGAGLKVQRMDAYLSPSCYSIVQAVPV